MTILLIGDDDVLVMPDPTPQVSSVEDQPKIEAKSRFFNRILSWIQSRYKLHRSQNCHPVRVRRKSTEFHSKKVLTTKFADITESERIKGQVILVSSKTTKSIFKTLNLVFFTEQMAARAIK